MENEKRKRRQLSEEFKAEAVRMVLSGERRQSEVSRNLGISTSAINKWCREARGLSEKQKAVPLPEDLTERCKKLEAENRRLRLEQEILKKATAYFAKDLL